METKNAVLLMVLVFGAVWADSDEVQDGDLHIETFQHGNEEEVTILDKNNKVVATVEILEEEGLQIDKPVEADEHPCFLRSIETESEETTPDDKDICYVRNAVSYEDAMGMGLNATHVFDQCQSLYMLEQQSCDVIDSKATAGGDRKKRSWPVGNYCCHYKEGKTVKCVRSESYCCKRFLGICIRHCQKCKSYAVVHYTMKMCHYG